jgi:hypothetical protein
MLCGHFVSQRLSKGAAEVKLSSFMGMACHRVRCLLLAERGSQYPQHCLLVGCQQEQEAAYKRRDDFGLSGCKMF